MTERKLTEITDGWIQQIGAPKEIYDKPNNIFVGGFIGTTFFPIFWYPIEPTFILAGL